ncbi:MAG: hypothetical protein ABGZ24_26695, partial [Fuerstiella sp.]
MISENLCRRLLHAELFLQVITGQVFQYVHGFAAVVVAIIDVHRADRFYREDGSLVSFPVAFSDTHQCSVHGLSQPEWSKNSDARKSTLTI